MPAEGSGSFRILCVGETWLGSDARAAFEALERLGQTVHVIDENTYVPNTWQRPVAKAIRKLFRPILVNELRRECVRLASSFRPHCLFVFKGNNVHPSILSHYRKQGILTVNYYPDVSFLSHGRYIPRTLPLYDHIFNTKTYGVADMKTSLGVKEVSFLPPSFDPDLHKPIELTADEETMYGCDVAFIGTWSPKKEKLLESLQALTPRPSLKIWGNRWESCSSDYLKQAVMGTGVTGTEYTKAIRGAAICLGLLSERGKGSSSGDLITARTFQIPACGTFMLHERNDEVVRYFEEGRDAEFFSSAQELTEKIERYLNDEDQRKKIANSGLIRSQRDGYSADGRMKVVLTWLNQRIPNTVAR